MLPLVVAVVLSFVSVTEPSEPAGTGKPAGNAAQQPAGDGSRPRQPGGGPGGGGQGGERRASVGGAMKLMDRNLEPLERQISDPAKKDENLGFVNEMQRGCVTAKGLPLPKDVLQGAGDEAAQAKLKQTFRAEMMALLKKLISLEEAISEGKLDSAKTILAEVTADRDRAHKEMDLKDEEKPFWEKK